MTVRLIKMSVENDSLNLFHTSLKLCVVGERKRAQNGCSVSFLHRDTEPLPEESGRAQVSRLPRDARSELFTEGAGRGAPGSQSLNRDRGKYIVPGGLQLSVLGAFELFSARCSGASERG